MLLRDYTFETSLPECNTFAETLNVIASFSDDITEVLPYPASVIKLCNYDDATEILTFKKDGKGIAVYPRQIAVTKLRDREEAVKAMISRTWSTAPMITARISSYVLKRVENLSTSKCLSFYRYELQKKCSQRTCLAFATKLVHRK